MRVGNSMLKHKYAVRMSSSITSGGWKQVDGDLTGDRMKIKTHIITRVCVCELDGIHVDL